LQTSQEQAITGTPWLVPVPIKVIFIWLSIAKIKKLQKKLKVKGQPE
jgi:hypothetical protein